MMIAAGVELNYWPIRYILWLELNIAQRFPAMPLFCVCMCFIGTRIIRHPDTMHNSPNKDPWALNTQGCIGINYKR